MNRRLGFMFAGQGAQFAGMGKDLAAQSPAAQAAFARTDEVLQRKLSDLCFTGSLAELTESANCQPAIYAVSMACLAALRERLPTAAPVIAGGLSLGEFAALAAADALDFETGLQLVAARGAFFGDACRESSGGMAAVINADPALVERVCGETGIDVANYNCPGQIVISGPKDLLPKAVDALKAAGVGKIVVLQVAGAFHSRLMQPAADRFAPVLETVQIRAPRCTVVQNVTGGAVADPVEIRRNLARQITGSVRWESCIDAMLAAGVDALVEFGPGQVLAGFVRRVRKDFPVFSVGTVADLEKAVVELGQ